MYNDVAYNYMTVIDNEGKYNFLTPSREFVSKEWFDDIRPYQFDRARVARGYGIYKEWNIVDEYGNLILSEWCKNICRDFEKVIFYSEYDGIYTYYNDKHFSIFESSYLKSDIFGEAVVTIEKIDGTQLVIDIDGNVIPVKRSVSEEYYGD